MSFGGEGSNSPFSILYWSVLPCKTCSFSTLHSSFCSIAKEHCNQLYVVDYNAKVWQWSPLDKNVIPVDKGCIFYAMGISRLGEYIQWFFYQYLGLYCSINVFPSSFVPILTEAFSKNSCFLLLYEPLSFSLFKLYWIFVRILMIQVDRILFLLLSFSSILNSSSSGTIVRKSRTSKNLVMKVQILSVILPSGLW